MVKKGRDPSLKNPVKLLQFNNKFFKKKRDKSAYLPDRFTKVIRLAKIFQGEFLIEFYDFTENEFLKTPLIDKSLFNIH